MKIKPYVYLFALSMFLTGCGTTVRKSGQVELFMVHPKEQQLIRAQSANPLYEKMMEDIGSTRRSSFIPVFGDRVRLNSDVLCINVHSIYLDSLPTTLTGSHDVIVFADVWENGAEAYDAPSLTSVVYAGKNQQIPGRCNVNGQIVYGPTKFKGHALKIKFTVMILQKEKGERQGAVADVVQNAAKAIPTYGIFVSQAAAVMRDVLRAQPDIICFDYETTFMSDKPEGHADTLLASSGIANSGEAVVKNIQNLAIKTIAESADRETATKIKNFASKANTFSNDHSLSTYLTSCGIKDEHAKTLEKAIQSEEMGIAKEKLLTAESRLPITDNAVTRDFRTKLQMAWQELNIDKPLNSPNVKTGLATAAEIQVINNPFYIRYGWLNYGFYALVETEARRSLTISPTARKASGNSKRNNQDINSTTNAFNPDTSYLYDGGWIYQMPEVGSANERDKVSAASRLKSKYIVFSITPGQLEEGQNTLLAASKANANLLQSLRQSPENLTAVAASITNSVNLLKETVLKDRLRSLALREAAKYNKNQYEEKGGKTKIQTLLNGKVDNWSKELSTTADVNHLVEDIMSEVDSAFAALN